MAVEKKPKCFFFIEQGGFTQSNLQAFGPVAGNEYNEFRVTAKFSCANTVKAFSICKGVVLIQPQAGSSTKVNLVLRPFNQPYPGLNIKYFVYRGLRRSDFFTPGGDPLVKPHVNNVTSDLIKKVNADFDSFYSEPIKDTNGNVIPKPAFSAKFIGFDAAASDSMLLSDMFFKESVFQTAGGNTQESSPFELPLIDEGKWLGNFDAGDCGIDVVLNYGDYKYEFDNGEFVFDLGYARVTEAVINAGSGTAYEKKLKREQSNQFIDVAAFYGLFVDEGTVRDYSSTTLQSKEGLLIYDDLLSPFDTRNRWYIYIQSDRARSYNFYGNYIISSSTANNLKIGNDEGSLVESAYGSYGWPVIINVQQQQPAATRNKVLLQLVTDRSKTTSLFISIGINAENQGKLFFSSDELLLSPDEQGIYQNFTRKISISNASTITGMNVCSLAVMLFNGCAYKYVREEVLNQNNQLENLYAEPKYFDDVFDLIKYEPYLTTQNGGGYLQTVSQKLNQLTYYDDKQLGSKIIQTLTVKDTIETGNAQHPLLQRVTYLTESVIMSTDSLNITKTLAVEQQSSNSSFTKNTTKKTYELPEPYYYEIAEFKDGFHNVKALVLNTNTNSIAGKIIVGVTSSQNEALKNLIVSPFKNARLVFLELFAESNILMSAEGLRYQKFKVAVIAEDYETLKLLEPNEDVIVFSIDLNFFVSKEYSEYMKYQNEQLDNSPTYIQQR